MPKPIPPPTVGASVPPDRSRRYFDDGVVFGFHPEAAHFSLCNAWWLAEASFAAYENFGAGDVTQASPRIDLSQLQAAGYRVTPVSGGHTQFLAIENAEVLIVAFRGTRVEPFAVPFFKSQGFSAHWGDVVTDARFLPFEIAPGVLVHAGFQEAFRAVEDKLAVVMERARQVGKPVWFCGHSLGGALATLAAHAYRNRTQGLYTFGSPRVGNAGFASALSGSLANIYRFVHHRDLVTTVPPEGLPLGSDVAGWRTLLSRLRDWKQAGYVHVGRVKFITGQGTWEIRDDETAPLTIASLAADAKSHVQGIMEVMRRGFKPTDPATWPILWDALSAHSPLYYTNKIYNALEQASKAGL